MENPLQENGHIPTQVETKIQIRVPKRVIHCSDGVIEEFSDEEVDSCDKGATSVDPKKLSWGPWFVHYAWVGSNKALEYCDYVGEGLAEFFRITTPKYQLELNEYERQEAARKKASEESAAWINAADSEMVTIQPSPINSLSNRPVDL